MRCSDPPPTTAINSAASSDVLGAEKTHERLSAIRTEKYDLVPLRCFPLHSRRPYGHARDRQSDGGRPLFKQSSDGGRRDVSLQHVPIDLGGVASREVSRHS